MRDFAPHSGFAVVRVFRDFNDLNTLLKQIEHTKKERIVVTTRSSKLLFL